MLKREAGRELNLRLQALTEESGEKVAATELAEIVHSMISTIHGALSSLAIRLYQELDSLVQHIHPARDEITALCPYETSEGHIPTATGELEAIVRAPGEASGAISGAIESMANEIGGARARKRKEKAKEITFDKDLLHGPQLAQNAAAQDGIDALVDGFD